MTRKRFAWRAARRTRQIALMALAAAGAHALADEADEPGAGPVLDIGAGRTAAVVRIDSPPFVDSGYSRRHRFDSFDNPKLRELRERFRLDDVVAPGVDEFERQVLLMDWTHRQFRRFGRPSANAAGALEVLEAIEAGHTFFCKQYAEVLVSCAASLGWVNRPLALRRHRGAAEVGGSTEHSVVEMWSNQFAKWVVFDPTSNLYFEKDGVPLNAWEVRDEWFRHGGEHIEFVVGRERRHHRKADLPIVLGTFEGFGELAFHPDEPFKYGFIGYVPNNDLMDRGFHYGAMFITKDEHCEGTEWHTRPCPENPATDPYFPVGQAAITLHADASAGGLRVELRTLTPNFERFEARTDADAEWRAVPESFPWRLKDSGNRLEARTRNRFGVTGPVSAAVVECRAAPQ